MPVYTMPPCKFSLNESCNITQPYTPLLIYQSANHPGVNGNTDEIARDMLYGTHSLDMLRAIDGLTDRQIQLCEELDYDSLFSSFINLVRLTSVFQMQTVALDMVEHFKSGNGADYENPTLTRHVQNHTSTKKYINDAKSIIRKYILEKEGNIKNIREDTAKDFEKLSRPKFTNPIFDRFGGLQITINDTWGLHIELRDFVYCKSSSQFNGKLDFVIYDHFGLDESDVNKFGGRLWCLVLSAVL